MNRPPVRLTLIALGVVAALAALVALGAIVILGSTGKGLVDTTVGAAVPLVAGGAVAILSWLLLGGPLRDSGDSRKATVRCVSCGTEVREEWRLCPYCGGPYQSEPRDHTAAGA
jgi:hypothetical protein